MATATYTPIATQDMAGIATVTFSSISGYTDIIVVGANLTRGTANSTFMRFNGDTGTNYSWTMLDGNGTSATSSRATNQTGSLVANGTTGLGTNPTQFIAQVMNYSNATTYKNILTRDTDNAGSAETTVGLWRNTSAVTSITVYTGGNFTTGTISLYGIKAA